MFNCVEVCWMKRPIQSNDIFCLQVFLHHIRSMWPSIIMHLQILLANSTPKQSNFGFQYLIYISPNGYRTYLKDNAARYDHLSTPPSPIIKLRSRKWDISRTSEEKPIYPFLHMKIRLESVFRLYRNVGRIWWRQQIKRIPLAARVNGAQTIKCFAHNPRWLNTSCRNKTANSSSSGNMKVWNQIICSRFTISSSW